MFLVRDISIATCKTMVFKRRIMMPAVTIALDECSLLENVYHTSLLEADQDPNINTINMNSKLLCIIELFKSKV